MEKVPKLLGHRLAALAFTASIRPHLASVIRLGVTQLVAECMESRPITPEYGQDGTCAARPISSISCTKTVQLRNSCRHPACIIRHLCILIPRSAFRIFRGVSSVRSSSRLRADWYTQGKEN